MYIILFIGIAIASWLVSNRLQSKFKEYSKLPLDLTGKEVAEKMLREYGLSDVKVVSVSGHLSDHYNPSNKTVNLSTEVYSSASVAAAAVAAHECAHALQHAQEYKPLQLRSALVPVVSFASNIMSWILLGGIIMLQSFPQLLLGGIILFAMTTLFSFVTLPVEINASDRALQWLETAKITTPKTQEKAKNALKWAAYTYVVAALGSLASLLYYVFLFLDRRD